MAASLAVDGAVAALLVWIAREDGLRFRISNRLVLALALGFPVACLIRGQASLVVPHSLFALAALAVLFVGFAAGICGGGDAKLLATALLWIGPEGTLVFAVLLLPAVLAYAWARASVSCRPAARAAACASRSDPASPSPGSA